MFKEQGKGVVGVRFKRISFPLHFQNFFPNAVLLNFNWQNLLFCLMPNFSKKTFNIVLNIGAEFLIFVWMVNKKVITR